MTQAIMPYRAQSSAISGNPDITVSFKWGDENRLAKGWWNDTQVSIHAVFPDDILRWPKVAFGLCPLRDGIRDKAHAEPTQILALDFDSPQCSIDRVQDFFCNCDHVIYTTRSHQKDKHGVTCDRFRIVLPLDSKLDPSALPAVVDWFGGRLGADTACKDGARFFYCGIETSLIYRHVHPLRLSTNWLLSLAPKDAPEASPIAAPVRRNREKAVIALGDKKPHSKHISFLRKAWPNVKETKANTYEDVFSLMLLWIQEYGFDLAALKAALPQVEDVADFYGRHPHQWQGIDSTLEKALSYVLNSKRNGLQHKNRLNTVGVDTTKIDESSIGYADMASTLTGGDVSSFEDTAYLLNHAFRNYDKAIIDVQCGGGKSVVCSAIIAKSADKWLVVKDTVAACQVERERLIQYGVDSKDIQVLRGWDAPMCKANLSTLENLKWGASKKKIIQPVIDLARLECGYGFTAFYRKQGSPCEKCWAKCDFKASRTHRSIIGVLRHKRIVILTHARFLELVHWVSQKVLDPFRIVIDEEPAVYEGVGFGSKEIEVLLHTWKGCLSGKVEGHINGLLNSQKAGSIEDYCHYDRKELKALQGRASKLDPDNKETCYRYLHFMGYEADRFAFVEPDCYGKKLSFVRNRLNWTLSNDVYVLSASARFGLAEWEGFTVVRSKDQKEADGVTVYGYDANSTKHRIDKEAVDFLKYALGIVRANGRKRVLLALNKEDTQSQNIKTAGAWFKQECGKLGIGVEVAERGSIIGRNDWRDCDAVILGYGLFTSVSNVALKTSLVESGEVEGGRCWDSKTINGSLIRQPRIRTGFVDSGLRETDRRLYADEVYQVGLRGRARNWEGEGMDIITSAPAMDYLIPLQSVLPECKIVFGDTNLSEIKTEDLLKPDVGLCQAFGMTDNAPNRESARGMAEDLLSQKLGG